MTEPYIYQTVHTLGGRTFRLAEHIALLDMAAHTLFARSFPLDASRLAARIAPLLSAAKMPTDYSVFVQIRMSASGEVQIEIGDISLYKGYDLRSIRPDAISLTYELPFGGYPTSARQAIEALAHTQAKIHHARSVVRCDSRGIAHTCDDAPLFAVKGAIVYTSPAPQSIEGMLAAECIAAAKLELRVQPIGREQLTHFDELFYFDHRGITSLARCDNAPLLSLAAEHVAHAAAKLTL